MKYFELKSTAALLLCLVSPALLATGNCPTARTLNLDLPLDEKKVTGGFELDKDMLERAWHPLSRSFESVPMEPQPDHGLGIPKLDLCVRSSRRSGLVRLGISVTGSNITGHQRADSGQVPWITSGVEGNQMRRMTDDRYEYREILSIEENDPILRQPHYSY